MNADGADFSFRSVFRRFECFGISTVRLDAAPHAGQAGDTSRAHAEHGAEPDKGLFHATHEVDWPHPSAIGIVQAAQVEDGIADQLARPMIGDVTAAVDLVQGDTTRGQQFV